MERNKVLEEAKKNEIYQKYFPSPTTDKSHPCPPTSRDCASSSQSNITHQPSSQAPIIHNHYVSPSCAHQCKLDGVNSVTCTSTEVIRYVCELKDLVEKLTVTKSIPPQSPLISNPLPTANSVSSDTTENIGTAAPGEESSIITLDGFMFNDDEADMNLN